MTITRNSDNSVLNKGNAINIGKIKVKCIEFYVPHYTPSFPEQFLLSKQILGKVPTELQYVERKVFKKEMNTQILWTFELGSGKGINVPMWNFVGFQRRKGQDSQILNKDTFCRHPVTSAQCIIGTEKCTASAVLLNNDGDEISQGFSQTKEAFRAFIKR